jgi:PAS domain S-box-containing protein
MREKIVSGRQMEVNKMEHAAQRHAAVQSAMLQIAQAAILSPSLPELYATVQQLIGAVLPAENFHISLLDEQNQQILVRYALDAKGTIPPRRPIAKGLTEYAVQEGTSLHLTAEDLHRLQDSGEAIPAFAGVTEWLGAPLFGSTGKVVGVISLYLTDIDCHFQPEDIDVLSIVAAQLAQAVERIRLKEALRSNEAEFRKLLKAMPLPMAIINRAGEHTYINERFTQVFGYCYEDIPSRDHWRKAAFPDESYRQWASRAWKAAVSRMLTSQQESGQVEYNITCKNGSVCSVIASCSQFGDDIIATFTDISERHRHEQLMKATYERRRKNELMNELIREAVPTKQLVHESARIMGSKMVQPFSCFLVVVDEYQGYPREYWLKHMEQYHLLLNRMLDVLEDESRLAWDAQDGIGLLWFDFPSGEIVKAAQQTVAEYVNNLIASRLPDVKLSIGIADPAQNMAAIATHYRQARTAVMTGKLVWPVLCTFHYADMGVFQLLSCFTDETQIREYIDRTLGKLLRYDKRKRSAYLATLELILMSDNLKGSAETLGIHYHTLMFRKQRLEQIMDVSFEDYTARLAILNALHLLKLQK